MEWLELLNTVFIRIVLFILVIVILLIVIHGIRVSRALILIVPIALLYNYVNYRYIDYLIKSAAPTSVTISKRVDNNIEATSPKNKPEASNHNMVSKEKNNDMSNDSNLLPISCEAQNSRSNEHIKRFFPWPPPQGSDEKQITEYVIYSLENIITEITLHRGILLREGIVNDYNHEEYDYYYRFFDNHYPNEFFEDYLLQRKIKIFFTLGLVDHFLRYKLKNVGHSSLTYFVTPDFKGYAAVTRLEQIDESGSFRPGASRFSKDNYMDGNFIANFFKQLVKLPEGRYRLLVFFVTADPLATQYFSARPTLLDADRWVSEGCGILPKGIANKPLKDHRIFVRVYEFFSKGDQSILVDRAESIPIQKHLTALGLDLDRNR